MYIFVELEFCSSSGSVVIPVNCTEWRRVSGIGCKRTRQKEGKERWWRPSREAAQVTFHWYHSNSTYVSEHKTRPVYCRKHCCCSRSLLLNRSAHLMFYCGHVFVLSVLLRLVSELFVFLCWHCIDVFLLYTSFSNACNNRPVICSQWLGCNSAKCHRFAQAELIIVSVTISYFGTFFRILKVMLGVQIPNNNRLLTALLRYVACDDIVRKLGTWPIFLLFTTACQLSRLSCA